MPLLNTLCKLERETVLAIATREGKDNEFVKDKKDFFDGNVRYKFNNGYPANRTEEHSLFISDTILVIGENVVVEIAMKIQ